MELCLLSSVVEQGPCKAQVEGSNPSGGYNTMNKLDINSLSTDWTEENIYVQLTEKENIMLRFENDQLIKRANCALAEMEVLQKDLKKAKRNIFVKIWDLL